MCVRHMMFVHQGQTNRLSPGDKHFLHKEGGGGQTFLTHGGGTNIFTYTGDKHFLLVVVVATIILIVSKTNILARILTVPEGPEILVYDNCHFMALYALC